MFENPIFPKAEKFVNPATVPTAKVLTIYSDDPRNNEMYKKTCGMTVVVLEKPNIQNLANRVDNSVLENEITDLSTFFEQDSLIFVPSLESFAFGINVPENLNIDLENGIFKEINASDGTVSWTATITFDDVAGAIEYEYDLVSVE